MAPRGGCCSHPGRKMSPLCSTSGGSETLLRIPSLAGSIIDTLEFSLRPLEPRNLALVADLELREHGAWNISTATALPTSPFLLASRRRREPVTTTMRSSAAPSTPARPIPQNFLRRFVGL